MGADPLQPLSDVQQLIEQQTHIMVEQQSLLILGELNFAACAVSITLYCAAGRQISQITLRYLSAMCEVNQHVQ